MDRKKFLTNIVGWSIISCGVLVFACRAIQVVPALIELSQMKFYPENVPVRTVDSTNKFLLLWSKETSAGNQSRFFTQIFTPDGGNLVYITTSSINSLDYLTGNVLWSVDIPEDSIFHLYHNMLFSLDSYDPVVPFAPKENISIPSDCNSYDRSTLRVYDPNNGEKIWEYSYDMVYPNQIFFNEDTANIDGMTIGFFSKYISQFQVDIQSGEILGVICEDYGSYSPKYDNEGELSSNFYPISRERDWQRNLETPAFIVEEVNLIMVDRQTKQPLEKIEFSGFPLNPDDVQLIIKNDILVVYLNDSDQFFAFQMK
jgi:hypothetical protein